MGVGTVRLLTHTNELDGYKHHINTKTKEVTPDNVLLCNP